MRVKSDVIAQKLLNLFRQEHVIIGGWAKINPIFVNEATPDVMKKLAMLPTGGMLVQHIENLRSGKTPMDDIDHDLMPYAGMMEHAALSVALTDSQIRELESALRTFSNDERGLRKILSLPVIQQFGDDWIQSVHSALLHQPKLLPKWEAVVQTYNAYNRWDTANQIINTPVTERTRAQLQADMLEYETYLPMFGEAGRAMLDKLRDMLNTRSQQDNPRISDDDQSADTVR